MGAVASGLWRRAWAAGLRQPPESRQDQPAWNGHLSETGATGLAEAPGRALCPEEAMGRACGRADLRVWRARLRPPLPTPAVRGAGSPPNSRGSSQAELEEAAAADDLGAPARRRLPTMWDTPPSGFSAGKPVASCAKRGPRPAGACEVAAGRGRQSPLGEGSALSCGCGGRPEHHSAKRRKVPQRCHPAGEFAGAL